MAIFKELDGNDVRTSKSFLNQLVDVVNSDISGSTTRKQYQVFVTGGVGPGVTSSLFQTVFDQDFTLQTANAVFDMTIGVQSGSEVVSRCNPTIDINGKYLFPQNTLMMREKMDLYRLYAQNLLGDVNQSFVAVSGSTSNVIKEALFINFKRLFARDQIKRETFALKYNPTGSSLPDSLHITGSDDVKILTDINSVTNKEYTFGGQVSTIVDSANTGTPLGLLFLDKGVLVMDISRSFDQAVLLEGMIDAVDVSGQAAFSASLGELLSSASIDDIVDHIASTRFKGNDETSIAFQNITNINSTIYFCRLGADEFNYSSNPTYTDADNRIIVIDEGQEDVQQSFTFVTSVGLYNASDDLLAVAKVSRPIFKAPDRDVNLRIRSDF